MGDTTEAWRARIGRFAGGSRNSRKGQKSSRYFNINKFWAIIAIVAAISTVALLNNSGLSTPLTPIALLCSSQDQPFAAQNLFITTTFVVLLLSNLLVDPATDNSAAPVKSRIDRSSYQCFVENYFLLVLIIASATISILLLRGGIESNPGPFPCRLCSVVPETIASSIRHQNFHARRNKCFLYYCPACEFRSFSIGSLNFHVSMQHGDIRHIDPAATEQIVCGHEVNEVKCDFSTTSFWELVQHLCSHLANDSIRILCPLSGCLFKKDFSKVGNFRNHLSVHHPTWKEEGCPLRERHKTASPSPTPPLDPLEFPPTAADRVSDQHDHNNVSIDNPYDINSDPLNDQLVLDSIGKFYLHLYAQNLLPQETIQEICDNLIALTEIVHARMKLVLRKELLACEIPQDKVNLVHMKVLQADLLYASHHKSIPRRPTFISDYLRKKYFKDHFGFVEPKQINLEPADPSSKNTLQYVSIHQSLHTFLKDTSIQREVDASFEVHEQRTDPNEISNYTDGTLFKSEGHAPREIHLTMYQDSFNAVMNPLGSAKNKFKDLVVYFTIANIKSHLRALIDSKQLVLICRESVFKKFGAKKCLEEMKSELKKLESTGILYKGREWIKVVVQFMLGDNLGQHLIGGFIESFSGIYMCRFCEMKRDEFEADPSVTGPPRCLGEYNKCVLRAKLLDKPVKGIKKNCELNSLQYFSSVSHLPVCIAHDLFEGCVSWDMSGIIARFVRMKWFTYKLLNDRIRNFKCVGIDSRNKPAFVNPNGEKLGGHAVQNWMMLRIFYFIIGDKIQDLSDSGWVLYLQLKEMCEIFCAPSFKTVEVAYLKDVLIPQYYDTRQSVLSATTYKLKPKYHYVSHYPELMLRYGPLIHLWTMPYEQKHKFFKELMRNTKSFINPEKTCAVRQQMKFCYSTTSTLFDFGVFVESKTKQLSSTQYTGDLAYFISNLNWQNYFESNCVSSDGITFKKEDTLILSATETFTIEVGVIKVIASNETTLKFIIQKRLARYQNSKGIYEIDIGSLGYFDVITPNTLKYPVPQPVYIFSGRSCFSLKHSLIKP